MISLNGIHLSLIHISMVGCVGADAFGQEMCQALKDAGVDVSHVRISEKSSSGVGHIQLEVKETGVQNRIPVSYTHLQDDIESIVLQKKPQAVIIDSIQTMYQENVSSAPGSVSQVREATGVLMRLAKENNITIFIVGHVTKEGTVAGPRVLEHMVDTVLYFEGDRYASYRIDVYKRQG